MWHQRQFITTNYLNGLVFNFIYITYYIAEESSWTSTTLTCDGFFNSKILKRKMWLSTLLSSSSSLDAYHCGRTDNEQNWRHDCWDEQYQLWSLSKLEFRTRSYCQFSIFIWKQIRDRWSINNYYILYIFVQASFIFLGRFNLIFDELFNLATFD